MGTSKHTQDLLRSLTSKIEFNLVDTNTRIENKKQIRLWIEKMTRLEGFTLGHISFNFCSDEYLLKMNQKHLKHDYYTDIITFNFVEEKEISGDIYISVDRIKENAKLNNAKSTKQELNRVMIHGVLHLCGYNDKTSKQSTTMRAKEDYYLSLLS
jgi:probable rRNA maturation factor